MSSQNKKYYKKKTSNQHSSFPPCQKSAPKQPQKKPQNNTMKKLVTLVLYCVKYMVFGFWLVLGGDSKGYQLISISLAYDNTGFLIPEI